MRIFSKRKVTCVARFYYSFIIAINLMSFQVRRHRYEPVPKCSQRMRGKRTSKYTGIHPQRSVKSANKIKKNTQIT